ncbi:MAG: LmeA family phospholipid-binding protein [Nocardioidaceae bacterium]
MTSTRRRRGVRSFVVVVVLLAGLGLVADRVAESLAEDQLAAAVEDEAARYDLRAAATSAEIGGGPGFLPQLVRGDFSRISLRMRRPTIASVPAEELTADLTGIQVPREVLTGGRGATVTVGSADVRLRVSPAALTRFAASPSGLDRLTLRVVDGRLRAQLTVGGVEAEAGVRPQVRDGRVVLVIDDLPGVPSAIRDVARDLLGRGIEVPDLPFGAALKQVAVVGQSVVLTATASHVELRSS